jgi:hypothetical protein
MAVPGIVVPSRQQPQQQQPEKKDLIDQILRGLQVAQGITGVAVNTQKFMNEAELAPLRQELMQAQTAGAEARTAATTQQAETAKRIAGGEFLSPTEARQQGFVTAPEGVEGFPATVAGEEQQLVSQADLAAQIKRETAESQKKLEQSQKEFKSEQELRKEFSSLPVTKNTETLVESHDKLTKAAGLETAAGDIALIFNYMKMLDPGSTVREGEFATAEQAGGVPDRIVNLYNSLISGERLAVNRQQFTDVADQLMQGQLERFQGTADQYSRIAGERGFKPENVIPQRPLYMIQKMQQPAPGAPQQPAQLPSFGGGQGGSFQQRQRPSPKQTLDLLLQEKQRRTGGGI